jgi:hypothetical protein
LLRFVQTLDIIYRGAFFVNKQNLHGSLLFMTFADV